MVVQQLLEQEFEGKLNAVLVLNELMENKNLIDIFKDKQVNRKLFELVVDVDDEMTNRCALEVVNTLYAKFPFFVEVKNNEDEGDMSKENFVPKNGDEVEKKILEHIDESLEEYLLPICEKLEKGSKETLEQQYGATIEPFGALKLQVVKFIHNIVAIGSNNYAVKISSYLQVLLNYCSKYPWNSMLHNTVEQIFNEIFKKNSKYDDGFKTATIAESSLLDFIHDCVADTRMPNSERPLRNGLIATVVSISNIINDTENEYVQEELQSHDKWVNFAYTELKEANENNEKALAGHQSKTGDSDDDSANYETSMDKLFAVFTNLKESHDSSREASDSDEDEEVDTENITKDIESSPDKSENSDTPSEEVRLEEEEDKDTPEKEEHKEAALDEDKEESKISDESPQEEPQVPVDSLESTPIETPSKTQTQPKDLVEESNTYYDNSYWSVPSSYNLEDLLQDS